MHVYAKFHAFITLRAILAIFNTRHLHYKELQTLCIVHVVRNLLYSVLYSADTC